MRSFGKKTFLELKERKMFRTLIIYLGGAWVAIQVIALFIDRYDLSPFIFDLTMIFLIAGIPGSLVIAWFHGKSGTQQVTKAEISIHLILLIFAIVAVIMAYKWQPAKTRLIIEHDENTIAVLPFQNMSGDEEDEYFSDGITDDIITQLSKIENLQVISRFSVIGYKNTQLSLSEIASELNVNIILEGTVRRIGNEVRITAKLINVANEENMWAEAYDREMTQVFQVQSDVAENIARNLRVELSASERERINRQPTANLDAYKLYLKGRDYYYLYRENDNEVAIGLFKDALKLDPNYAMAYAGLGDAYGQRVVRFSWPDNWLDTTIVMANKAIELDPELAEGYKARALGYSYKGWSSLAIESDLLAIEHNPNFFPAISNLGVEYGRKGRIDQQIPLLEKTLALAPLFPLPYVELGEAFAKLVDDKKAIRFIEEAVHMQPDFTESYYSLAWLYINRGDLETAYKFATKGLELTPEDPGLLAKMGQIEMMMGKYDNAEAYLESVYDLNLGTHSLMDPIGLAPSYLGYVYLQTEKSALANLVFEQIERSLRDAIDAGNEYYKCKVELGRIYAIRDNKEEALLWLNQAYYDGWNNYRLALIDPTFTNIKHEPEFTIIIEKMRSRVKEMKENLETSRAAL
jgi:TolB-like protein